MENIEEDTSLDFFKDLEHSLQPLIEKVLSHPFLKRINDATLTKEQLQYFARQYGVYCQAFPRFLAAVAAAIKEDELRYPLIENLWEEHGEGKLEKSHRMLFYKFAQSLGLSKEDIRNAEPLSSTHICVEYMMNMCQEGPFLQGLGALGPGTEFFTSEEYSLIVDGLRKYDWLGEDAIEFWWIHIGLDDHHYHDMIEPFRIFLDNEENRKLIANGAKRAIELELLFWNGLEENLLI